MMAWLVARAKEQHPNSSLPAWGPAGVRRARLPGSSDVMVSLPRLWPHLLRVTGPASSTSTRTHHHESTGTCTAAAVTTPPPFTLTLTPGVMTLLLRGCVAPVGHAAFHRAALLPRRRPSSRLVTVASAPASSPASSASAGDGAAAVALSPDARSYGAVPATSNSTVIETAVERVIFDFRFLALLAVAGSLAGSLLCFLNGCVFIKEAFQVYWTGCLRGIHSGQMVLKVVEAIDVYLAGTVMLIFAMGLYGLFISNASADVPSESDRALQGSSLFGMFALKERPKWMQITSLDQLKTKVGHVIVMILLVKMFERSKTVAITSGMDLLSYSVCIFLSSASLYILHNLHKDDHEDDGMPNL